MSDRTSKTAKCYINLNPLSRLWKNIFFKKRNGHRFFSTNLNAYQRVEAVNLPNVDSADATEGGPVEAEVVELDNVELAVVDVVETVTLSLKPK